MTRVLIIAAIGLGVILMIVALVNGGGSSVNDAADSTPARLAYMLAALTLVGGGAVATFRREGVKALRYVAVWIGIGGLIALLYMVLYPNGSM